MLTHSAPPLLRALRSFAVATLAGLAFTACGGGGGGGSPNPAARPTPTTTTNLNGFWVCMASELGSSNTIDTHEIEVGEVLQIESGLLIGNVTTDESYLRADVEQELGFPLQWYENRTNGGSLDFGLGWDRLAQGAGLFVDYEQYGLRLAATGADELSGFETAIEQETRTAPRTQWSFGLRFARLSARDLASARTEAATRIGPPPEARPASRRRKAGG